MIFIMTICSETSKLSLMEHLHLIHQIIVLTCLRRMGDPILSLEFSFFVFKITIFLI